MTAIRINSDGTSIPTLFERLRSRASAQYDNNAYSRAQPTIGTFPNNPFAYPDNELHALLTAFATVLHEQLGRLEITIDDSHIDSVDVEILERAATWLALKVIERTPK